MKNIKLIICMLLAGSLLLSTACGGGNSNNDIDTGVGRYVETDITPPISGRFTSFLSADGAIVCFSEGLAARYESADGGANWTETPGPGSGSDRYGTVQSGTMLDDGSLLVFVQGEGLEIIAPDGSSKKYSVDELDNVIAGGENINMSLMQVMGNRLMLSYMIGGFTMQQTRNGGAPVGGNAPAGGRQPTGDSGYVSQYTTQGDSQNSPQGNPQGGAQRTPQGGEQNNPQGGEQGNPQGVVVQGNPQDRAQRTPQGAPQQGNPQGGAQGFPQNVGVEQVDPQGDTGDETPGNAPTEVSGEESSDANQTPGMPGRQPGGASGTPMQMRSKTLLCDLATGQIIADMQVENASSAVARDNNMYLMDANGNVSIYDLNDGSSLGKPEIKFAGAGNTGGPGDPGGPRGLGMRMPGISGNVLALGGEGSLYAVLDGSLLLADSGGNVSTVLGSTETSIGEPRSRVNSIFALNDGSIVVNMLESSQNNRLYKYAWNENATVDPNKTLTIWSLSDNYFIRAAIAELRKKHSDSRITYEIALDGNSGVSASDAIKTLNSRLLSGEGPDIILLDGCSVESYADKGMLLDLSGLINTGDVFDSLLGSYMKNGKLFCLPTQFFMPMLMGTPEALADVGSLDDLVRLVVDGNDLPASGGGPRPFSGVEESERSALYFNDLTELCNALWVSCAPDIVKDNRLDTDNLRRYLEAVKSISDKYALTETGQGRNRTGMSVAFSDGGVPTALPGSLMWYTMQLTHYAAFSAGNLQLLQMMMDRVGSTLELFPGLTPGAWQPSTVVGTTADTKNPQFAAELIQTMLSVDVQQLNYSTGLPVTRAGLAAQVDAINVRRAENGEEPFSFDPNILVSRLLSPSIRDTILTDMMWNSVEKCCKGEIDIEGAVKEIEQNVKNYLAERT
jgi:ABC-type glycerol-3-phosphate transport system substrate-binding protein